MQRFFDLASCKGEKGEKTRDSNIFRKYGLGIHQPTRKSLLKVEKVSPNSSRILVELIWKVLLCEHFTHNKCQRMLKCLPLEIRNLIFAKDSHGRLQRVSEQDIVSRLNGRYEIATLTTYTNLSRESIYTQDRPVADFWSKHLFLVFLGLCRYLKLAGIGDAMLPIFESLIFSRTVTGAKRYRELPELFHNMGEASPLSGMKERKSFIASWARGELIPGRGTSFHDCLTGLKLARKSSTNVYKGLLSAISKHYYPIFIAKLVLPKYLKLSQLTRKDTNLRYLQ